MLAKKGTDSDGKNALLTRIIVGAFDAKYMQSSILTLWVILIEKPWEKRIRYPMFPPSGINYSVQCRCDFLNQQHFSPGKN
jgi:hypothetical protein